MSTTSIITSTSDSQKISEFADKYCKTKKEHDYFKIFSLYMQSNFGTRTLFKLLIDGCKWPIHYAYVFNLSSKVIKKLSDVQNRFRFISKNLILTKFPKTIVELNNSYDDYINAYKKAKIKDITRKRDNLASKIVQTVADGSFLIQLGEILSLYSLGVISSIINFTGNFFVFVYHCVSLKTSAEDYFEHDEMQKIVKNQKKPIERLLTLFREIKNLDLLKIIKTIISIAISVFLLLDIAFKITIVSASSLLFLSTFAIILAIWSYFYKESMTYPFELKN